MSTFPFSISTFYPQCPPFLRSKVHLYEVFNYEARFSRSKVDFRETLPETLLFRECLFADSYNLHGQVHF